jgi:hypothetical protein
MKLMTKSDKWLIVVLLIAASLGVIMSKTLFTDGGRKYVQISVNGKIAKTILPHAGYHEEIYAGDKNRFTENDTKRDNLARNVIKGYNVQGYNIIEINSDKVRVKDAGCPDLICVKTGWISLAPQQIVCLPNRMIVKIISANNSGQVDDIAR